MPLFTDHFVMFRANGIASMVMCLVYTTAWLEFFWCFCVSPLAEEVEISVPDVAQAGDRT